VTNNLCIGASRSRLVTESNNENDVELDMSKIGEMNQEEEIKKERSRSLESHQNSISSKRSNRFEPKTFFYQIDDTT
jgi:hypothetical protein